MPAAVAALFALGLVIASTMGGCTDRRRAEQAKAGVETEEQRRLRTSNALIQLVTSQLRDLPDLIALNLTPPAVVLDSTTSRDGNDVLATIAPSTEAEANALNPNLNLLSVPARNGGFRAAGIQPGDIVKCYLLPDAETRRRLKETGELFQGALSYESVDLEVAQMLDDNNLRTTRGLRVPLRVARDLSARLDSNALAQLRDAGLPEDFVAGLIMQLNASGNATGEGVPLPPAFIQLLPGIAWPFKIEVWRTLDQQMIQVNNALTRYAERADPPLGWEPSPDASALLGIVESLNQWLRSRDPQGWAPAELVATLEPELLADARLGEFLSNEALRRARFADHEARWIQEAVWIRDAARWVTGGRLDPLERAELLFDWTVRNVTLTDDPRVVANRPWQTLLHGRGTVEQRAWLFAMLCHHQRLTAVVLELPPNAAEAASPRLWCAVIDEGKAYLFDPQLGLAIDGADGGVATLAEVQADDGLLRKLDLDDAPYPPTSEQAQAAVACVVGDPMTLSRRAAELASQLTGGDTLALAVDADAVAADAAAVDSIGGVELWSAPIRLLRRRLTLGPLNREAIKQEFVPYAWRPKLWKARVLHLRGVLETEQEVQQRNDPLHERVDDHRSAGLLYMDRSLRRRDSVLETVAADKRQIYARAKSHAAYWLGVLQFDNGSYDSSDNWLKRVDLENRSVRRAEGVRYNRGRALEAAGDLAAAAELFEGSKSPQRHGDRLRARRLREQLAAALTTEDAAPTIEDAAPTTEDVAP